MAELINKSRPSLRGVLGSAVATALQRPQSARTRSVRRCSEIPRDEDLPVYPVFDPRTDELPFPVPFDNSMTSYQFTSAAHARLVDAALAVEPPQFFHVVRREPLRPRRVLGDPARLELGRAPPACDLRPLQRGRDGDAEDAEHAWTALVD